jgi:hypothetical protein
VDRKVDVGDRNLPDQQYPEENMIMQSEIKINRVKILTQSPKFIGFPSTMTLAE